MIVLVMVGTVETKVKQVNSRIKRVEHKLDAVLAHLGITDFQPDLTEVSALLAENKRMKAIKRYRELTDSDLLEAKQAVDRLTTE